MACDLGSYFWNLSEIVTFIYHKHIIIKSDTNLFVLLDL